MRGKEGEGREGQREGGGREGRKEGGRGRREEGRGKEKGGRKRRVEMGAGRAQGKKAGISSAPRAPPKAPSTTTVCSLLAPVALLNSSCPLAGNDFSFASF